MKSTGTVKDLDWRSPHARLYVDAVDGEGNVVSWNFELPSPMTLMRRGWKRDSLKPGDKVTVKAARARHVSAIGYAIAVRDSGGKPLFTGERAPSPLETTLTQSESLSL